VTEGYTPDAARFGRKPVYAVLFSADVDFNEDYTTIVAGDQRFTNFTVPHGLDRSVATALPGLWYCLHLPNDLAELVDTPARILKRSQAQHLDHQIIFSPIQIFDGSLLSRWLEPNYPVLVVCPDDLAPEASERSQELGFILPAAKFSELSDESLQDHWREIHANLVPDAPYLGREPRLSRRLDLAVTKLPKTWLARQMGFESTTDAPIAEDQDQLVGEALDHQAVLAAVARLEIDDTPPPVAERELPQAIEQEKTHMRMPVALALPGVAAGYSRRVYDTAERARIASMPAVEAADTWSTSISERPDTLIERSAIEFITAHRAIARSGVGLMFPSVPQEAFNILGQLEDHFRRSRQPSAPKVRQLLDRLNRACQSIWTDLTVGAVARASMLTVFSNFPIGLLQLPGDSEPLSSRVPIAYRPILPLTNATQRELMFTPAVEVPEDFTVLVAECIPDSDPVGRHSRSGWRATEDLINSTGQGIKFRHVETLSIASLRAAIDDNEPNFLVISAHGAFDRTANVAGLMVGHEFTLGPELGPMPEVVILSACHVAPRGTTAVSITDLLLRQEAVAVLGTQVPVDVGHNAILMSRFLLYIRETMAGREEHSNLLEVWHRTQTTNAVIDILNGSESLRSWGGGSAVSGRLILEEFMSVRSVGRLRNIYSDTEQVLGEIADELGQGSQVRNWLRRPGYVPESLFYVFAGKPERIYLRPLIDAWRNVL
jgi:hypothetical protein